MKAKSTVKQKNKTEPVTLSSLDVGKEDFNVVVEREAVQIERKKQRDWQVVEYRRRMGNAPELLEQELKHLRAIEPGTTTLAHRMLAKYLEPEPYEAPGVKKAVNDLRKECLGTLNLLSGLVPAITDLLGNITYGAASHIDSYTVECMVDEDWRRVRSLASGGLNFTDFAERMATLEEKIKEKVRYARADQRNGTAAPVDRSSGPPTEQIQGHGEVIVIRNITEEA